MSSMDEWIHKTWCRHKTEYYSALNRNEVLIHVTTRMNLGNIMLSEISQTQKNKYYMIPLI